MFKWFSILSITLVLGLLIFMSTEKNEHQVDDCHLNADFRCEIMLTDNTVLHVFKNSPDIRLERKNKITLTFDKPSKIFSVYLSGVNFYMGKIPVEVNRINEYQYELFVIPVLCAEANMLWRVTINSLSNASSFKSVESLQNATSANELSQTQTTHISFETRR